MARATLERNVSTLHRAGADFVMSYASMGANAILNILEGGDIVMVAEGLDVFRVPVPPALGDADARLPSGPGKELILIGTTPDEQRFMRKFSMARSQAGGAGS